MAAPIRIRQARPDEAARVAAVLTAAALALESRGQALWKPADVAEAAIAGHVREGRYFLAEDEDGPVGAFRIDLEDPVFWPEMLPGSSAYLHKVAVHPRAQGREIAQQLLSHAAAWRANAACRSFASTAGRGGRR